MNVAMSRHLLYSSVSLFCMKCISAKKPRLAELTVRYEALRCDIMQQYYMNKDYDNVIRIATSLDFHDDTDPNASCLVYYYKAQAYVKVGELSNGERGFLQRV